MSNGFYDSEEGILFATQTSSLDMSHLYEPFLKLLKTSGHILDAGCGSGRDTKHFIEAGYRVTAIDNSPNMVSFASNLSGQPALLVSFEELRFEHEFDGIWACASLLHVPKFHMNDVLGRLVKAMLPKGIMYLSFKEGQGEVVRDTRLFNNYSEHELRDLLSAQNDLTVLQVWLTTDVRKDRGNERWLNVLVQKEAEL